MQHPKRGDVSPVTAGAQHRVSSAPLAGSFSELEQHGFGHVWQIQLLRERAEGVIAEADSTRLLKPKLVELATEWVTLFSARAATPHPAYPLWVLSDLSATRAHMAVEAYRRGLITKTELLTRDALTLSLQVPGLSETKLLEFAEAAR